MSLKRKTDDSTNDSSHKKRKTELEILQEQKLKSLTSKDYDRICKITNTVLKGKFKEMNGGK